MPKGGPGANRILGNLWNSRGGGCEGAEGGAREGRYARNEAVRCQGGKAGRLVALHLGESENV